MLHPFIINQKSMAFESMLTRLAADGPADARLRAIDALERDIRRLRQRVADTKKQADLLIEQLAGLHQQHFEVAGRHANDEPLPMLELSFLQNLAQQIRQGSVEE